MKRKYIVILIILWAMAFAKFIYEADIKETDIVTAFSNDSFLSTDSSVRAVAYVGNIYYSEEAKKDMLASIAGTLGINDVKEFEVIESEDNITVKYIKNSKYAVTELKFVTLNNTKDALVSRQYIMIDIDIVNSLESAVWYREEIENIMNGMGLDSEITLTLKGNISGLLEMDEKNNICNDIIERLGGEIVSERKDNEIYTVYAYSGFMDDYVVDDGEKININVAISYDEVLDETRIYMATPILSEDY